MASDIEIASNALILIGDSPIASFTEPGAGATAAANLYPSTYTKLLSEHPWSFAIKLQRLNRLSQKPDVLTRWTFAYQLPTDLIRLWNIQPHSNYQIIGSLLYTNQTEVLATYVFKTDETNLPPQFQKALEYKLAADFALLVTEDNNKSQIFEQKYRQEISQARGIDSQSHPQIAIVDQPFSDVRGGGFF